MVPVGPAPQVKVKVTKFSVQDWLMELVGSRSAVLKFRARLVAVVPVKSAAGIAPIMVTKVKLLKSTAKVKLEKLMVALLLVLVTLRPTCKLKLESELVDADTLAVASFCTKLTWVTWATMAAGNNTTAISNNRRFISSPYIPPTGVFLVKLNSWIDGRGFSSSYT